MRVLRHGAMVLGLVAAVSVAGCSHKSAPKENTALFLTLNHVSLAGDLAHASDERLLALGHKACADMDHGLQPDAVVADLGNNPEPGTASFNAYAYVAATASRELCPRHQDLFSGPLSGLGG